MLYHNPRSGRAATFRAPSWTWASIDGIAIHARISWSARVAKVLDHHLALADPNNPFGRVTDGFLVVQAPLQRLGRVDWSFDDPLKLPVYAEAGNAASIGEIWVDQDKEASRAMLGGAQLFYLDLGAEEGSYIGGLALVLATEQAVPSYRRFAAACISARLGNAPVEVGRIVSAHSDASRDLRCCRIPGWRAVTLTPQGIAVDCVENS